LNRTLRGWANYRIGGAAAPDDALHLSRTSAPAAFGPV